MPENFYAEMTYLIFQGMHNSAHLQGQEIASCVLSASKRAGCSISGC